MQHTGPGTQIEEIRSLLKQLEGHLDRLDPVASEFASSGAPSAEDRVAQVTEFAASVGGALDISQVLDRALTALLPIAGAERAFLTLRDSDKTFVDRLRASNQADGNAWIYQKIARLVVDRVFEHGQMVLLDDVSQQADIAEEAAAYDVPLSSLLALPLREGDRLDGVLYFDRSDGVPFPRRDLKLFQALGQIITRAGQAVRSMAEQTARRQNLELLNKLYQAISRTLELDQLLDQVAAITMDVTQSERAFILLMNNGQLRFGAGRDHGGPLNAQASREISRSVCQKVLQTQEGVYVLDTASDEEFSSKLSVVSLKLNSVVAVPLKGQQGLSGILYIDAKSTAMQSLEKEMAILTNIANVASLAIDNARLYRQATTDGLTSLYVRSFFMVRMEEEANRSARYGRMFSLLVLDIDHFKRFNDTYGHQTGDEVIKLVAHIIKRAIRQGLDIPGRYGGEELVLMLPETNADGAMIVAERIRQNIENTPLPGPNGESLRVTVSVGVGVFPVHGGTATQLFERADQALYHSKQNGRNRCSLAAVPPPTA
ncbi:MAG: diguanylate cyclase [Candidatus Sericytochromatia bacterium]|nr:diguanylate cyclase [Candidatus Sericytochromatia bacterium]